MALTAVSALRAADKPQKAAGASVDYNAFVNWDFHHRKKLTSWKTTALVIERTLEIWYGDRHPLPSLTENGPPEMLQKFLASLPGEKDCAFSIVYLASHQSPERQWDFTQKHIVLLDDLFAPIKIPPHHGRIVVLDACYAAAMADSPIWREKMGPVTLFAASPTEPTPDVNFRSRQPVDLARRYPQAYAWLKDCMGRKWDGKVSYLGFVWVQAFLATPTPPANMKQWADFLKQCQSSGTELKSALPEMKTSEIIATVGDR